MTTNTPDLTQRPPRSPRVRLGGFTLLPRLLDKGRATLGGKPGEYHYDCPLDKHWFDFAGISAEALLAELSKGRGDGEILEWVTANSQTKPSVIAILAWSAYQDHRGPTDLESRQYFNDYLAKVGPKREDIASWFDVLDLDDFVSFGGVA